MFYPEKSSNRSVIEICFDDWDCIDPLGPFWDIIRSYAFEAGTAPETVDPIFNYKFIEDGHKIQFYWNGLSRIYVFGISRGQYSLIYDRLNRICTELNRRIAEKKYLDIYGELPNNGRGFK